LTISSAVCIQYTNVTDRQTDRRLLFSTAACVNYRHEHRSSTVYTIHSCTSSDVQLWIDWQPTTTQRCHPLFSSWLLSFCATSCILTTTSTIPGLSQPHLHSMVYLSCRGIKPLVSFYSSCKHK